MVTKDLAFGVKPLEDMSVIGPESKRRFRGGETEREKKNKKTVRLFKKPKFPWNKAIALAPRQFNQFSPFGKKRNTKCRQLHVHISFSG